MSLAFEALACFKISAGVKKGFAAVVIAPRKEAPRTAKANAGELGSKSMMTSPCWIPSLLSPDATLRAVSSTSAKVYMSPVAPSMIQGLELEWFLLWRQ